MSKLRVGCGIDEHVDCTVGVCQPHYSELDTGRRLERRNEDLREGHDHIRKPEREVSDACERQDL